MFDRFGEFDSYRELNEAAEGLREEGDREALMELAGENGIDPEDAQDYMDGHAGELCNARMAALGKLQVERATLRMTGIMGDWLNYIEGQVMEHPEMAGQVRKKGKSLEGCIGALLKWSLQNQVPVPARIVKAAGVQAGRCTLGIPDMGQAKKIIREYYLGREGA